MPAAEATGSDVVPVRDGFSTTTAATIPSSTTLIATKPPRERWRRVARLRSKRCQRLASGAPGPKRNSARLVCAARAVIGLLIAWLLSCVVSRQLSVLCAGLGLH